MKKELLRFPCLIVGLLLSISHLHSQSTLSGTITDGESGEPLIGVNILVVGTQSGTVTDYNGQYELSLPDGSNEIEVSYVGFVTQDILVNGRTVIDIVMAVDAQTLDDVVIIGYGQIRKSDLTGSVYSVKSEELQKIPNPNVANSLQGKVPGLQVANASGNPGEAPVIRLRGVSTLLGTAGPIFVVDGVILDDINFLNSSDVESVEVLKDASAVAIYGNRGSRGVIIVTTKSGSGKDKQGIDAQISYGVERLDKKIDLLNGRQFAQAYNAIFPGTYNNLDALPNIDWQDQVFTDYTSIQSYKLGFTNSSDKSSFYLGGSYYNQEGIIEKSDYQRFTVKLNQTVQVVEPFKLGAFLNFAHEDKTNPPGVVATAYRNWPISEPFNPDGTFAEVQGASNPLASIEYSNSTRKSNRLVGNVFGELTLLKDFTFKSSYQVDYSVAKGTSFTPVFFVSAQQQNEINNLNKNTDINNTWIWENTLNYFKEFNIHRISVLAGYSAQEDDNEGVSNSVMDLLREDESNWYLGAGDQTTLTTSNSASSSSLNSILFRTNYTLRDKYLLTFTYRRDQSSKFAKANRAADFPAFAIGWRISEEPFFKTNFLDNLKLRASWGKTGNQDIPFNSRFARVSPGRPAVLGTEEVLQPGATIIDVGNPNLQWETSTTLDLAMEFGLLNGKLNGEIGYYKKQTKDVLVALLVPAHLGNGAFNRVPFNAADMDNSGLELSLTLNGKIAKEVKYGISIVGSTLKNEVTNLGLTDNFIAEGSLNNGQLVTRTEVGESVASFYGYQVIGVFQNETELANSATASGQGVGDLKFQDLDGDGKITPDDRMFLGSYLPDALLGLSLNFSYKQLALSADFQGEFGKEIYNGMRAVRPELYNWEASVANAWTGEGTSNSEPKVTPGGLNYSPSSYFIENGDFIRLRNVTLSYAIPTSAFDKIGLKGGSLYIRGTNLFTISDFSGYSPEISSNNQLSSGIDLGTYPITRVYTIGLNINL